MTYSPSDAYYWAQNMDSYFPERDSDVEEVQDADKTRTKNKANKRKCPDINFVMSKIPRKGHRLIRLEIFDLSAPDSQSATMSAQYTVTEPVVDEILELTEKLISKICNKITDN